MDNLYYYAFDIDDNLLKMPTNLYLQSKDSGIIGVSTDWYAKNRNNIGRKPIEYNGDIVLSFPKKKNGDIDLDKTFIDFSDNNPKIFIKDAIHAINNKSFCASWDDFIECLESGCLFAIITARGHEPKTIREFVEYVILNYLNDKQRSKMIDNLFKFSDIFQQGFKRPRAISNSRFIHYRIVKKYLDSCMYVGINSTYWGGIKTTLEQEKMKALDIFSNKVQKFASKSNRLAKIGFSDDDESNVDAAKKLFNSNSKTKFSNIIEYIIKDSTKNIKYTI